MPPSGVRESSYLSRLRLQRDAVEATMQLVRGSEDGDGIRVASRDRSRSRVCNASPSRASSTQHPTKGRMLRSSRRHSLSTSSTHGLELPASFAMPASTTQLRPLSSVTSKSPRAEGRSDDSEKSPRSRSLPETMSRGKYTAASATQLQQELAESYRWENRVGATLHRRTNPLRRFPCPKRLSSARRKLLMATSSAWAKLCFSAHRFSRRKLRVLIWAAVLFPFLLCSWAAFRHPTALWSATCDHVLLFCPDSTWVHNLCRFTPPSAKHERLDQSLADTNQALVSVADQSINMRVLPYLLQGSAGGMSKLQILVRYSTIQYRTDLEAECERYYVHAEEANHQLITFFGRITGLIHRVIRTTNHTINNIQAMHENREARCNTTSRFGKWVTNTVLSPVFGMSPVCTVNPTPIAQQLSKHINTISPEIALLLADSPALAKRFASLQDTVNSIQKLALADWVDIGRKEASLLEIWIHLGGPAVDESGVLEEQLQVMNQLPDYLLDAQYVMSSTIVSLRDMSARLERLNRQLWDAKAKRVTLGPAVLPLLMADLDELRETMQRLVLLQQVAELKQDQEVKQILMHGVPLAAMDDYRTTKAGGKMEYESE